MLQTNSLGEHPTRPSSSEAERPRTAPPKIKQAFSAAGKATPRSQSHQSADEILSMFNNNNLPELEELFNSIRINFPPEHIVSYLNQPQNDAPVNLTEKYSHETTVGTNGTDGKHSFNNLRSSSQNDSSYLGEAIVWKTQLDCDLIEKLVVNIIKDIEQIYSDIADIDVKIDLIDFNVKWRYGSITLNDNLNLKLKIVAHLYKNIMETSYPVNLNKELGGHSPTMNLSVSKELSSSRLVHTDQANRSVWTLLGPTTQFYNPLKMDHDYRTSDYNQQALIESQGNHCMITIPVINDGSTEPSIIQSAHAVPDSPITIPDDHPMMELANKGWVRAIFLLDYMSFKNDAKVKANMADEGHVIITGHSS